MAKFVLWKSNSNGNWYWHLKSAGNNQVVCWAEGYSTKQAALDSIAWVRKYAAGADFQEI